MQTKTKCMKFSRARNITDESLHITRLTGHRIERLSECKHLGICFDHNFHLKFIMSHLWQLKQNNGYSHGNKSNSPLSCRKRIIEAVFLSLLDYGDVIYSHASASLLPLSLHCSVYHCAFITPASYSTHHCILCERVEKAPLSVRWDKHWFLLIYKVLKGNMPPYLSALSKLCPLLMMVRSRPTQLIITTLHIYSGLVNLKSTLNRVSQLVKIKTMFLSFIKTLHYITRYPS